MTGPQDRDVAYSPNSGESLSYICDIIIELRNLADRSGQKTLSAILSAALTEARIQQDQEG